MTIINRLYAAKIDLASLHVLYGGGTKALVHS